MPSDSSTPTPKVWPFFRLETPAVSPAAERHAWDVLYRGNVLSGNPFPAVVFAGDDPDSAKQCHPGHTNDGSQGATTACSNNGEQSRHRGQALPHTILADTRSKVRALFAPSRARAPSVSAQARAPAAAPAYQGAQPASANGSHESTQDVPDFLRRSQTRPYGLRSQVYRLVMRIPQQVPADLQGVFSADTNIINLNTVIDTGSPLTWIYSYRHKELVEPKDSPDGLYTFRDWPESSTRANRQTVGLFNHPLRQLPAEKLLLKKDAKIPTTTCTYYNRATAALDFSSDAVYMEFRQAFLRTGLTATHRPLSLHYRLSVAYAATMNMLELPFDGILGLGLCSHQMPWPSSTATYAPPFTVALAQQVTNSFPAETGERGIIFYFCFRNGRIGSSFIGLNGWPCIDDAPLWSMPIPAISLNGGWAVEVLSVWFRTWRDGRWTDHPSGKCVLGTSETSGVKVLDTGASLSWVPEALIDHIRKKVFPTPENQAIAALGGDVRTLHSERPHYAIPPTESMGRWSIAFSFKGRKNSIVTATCRCDPFLCTQNPENISGVDLEGLLRTAPRDGGPYIFGLNFFQSMFVALHNPKPAGAKHRAYVRLAPQGGTRIKAQLPPLV